MPRHGRLEPTSQPGKEAAMATISFLATRQNVCGAVLSSNTTAVDKTRPADELIAIDDYRLPTLPSNAIRVADNWIMLEFFGTNAANEEFDCSVYGYKHSQTTGANSPPNEYHWSAQQLLDVHVILGTATGVANGQPTASDFYADTITVNSVGITDYQVYNPANNTVGAVALDCRGYSALHFGFDMTTTGTDAANGNANYRFF
jgi:hypothetical protein